MTLLTKEMKVMSNDNGVTVSGILLIVVVCGLISTLLSGCSFKIETLYHGQTPIGLDHRQATALQEPRKEPRVVRVND